MMKIAQKIENREDIRREANLPGYSGGRTTNPQNNTKANTNSNVGENKGGYELANENHYSTWDIKGGSSKRRTIKAFT